MSERLEQRREALREKEGEYRSAIKVIGNLPTDIMDRINRAVWTYSAGGDPIHAVFVLGQLQNMLEPFEQARAVIEQYEREKQILTDMERLENEQS